MAKTIAEIAEETGYSRTTITMVLSGRANEYRISERAQNAINAYVAEHGYTINQTARSLKTRQSQTVGFVAPDIANAFFARVMAHLEEFCRAEGLVLVTTSSAEDPEVEARALSSLVARGVDGLVLAPCTPRPREAARKRAKATPLVLIDRAWPGDAAPAIASNHEENARLLTEGIVAAGVEDIAFLCGHPDNPSIGARVTGFYGAGKASGIDERKLRVLTARHDSVAAGESMMEGLLAADNLPPAILCSSLLVLEGALRRLKRERGNVPADLIVGTFDYDGFLELLPNPVIVVRQDEEALARAAFDALRRQMKEGKAEKQAEKADPPPRKVIAADLMRLGTWNLPHPDEAV
ncbi:substrate-binding domain-containing protein [Martelella endophytica]|uniref:substrate-binding domain-containing protein n=1 Tax=Martelella endophytica TaxID=1486262 RepID=UPI000697AB22|nr:substrate-binding domain-containing protein [Martelella endophytica]